MIFSLFLFVPSLAYAWPARVVAVTDGDTITVEPLDGGDRVKVRLYGIDCPESKQPYGQAAKGFVNNAVLFQTVSIMEIATDRYKRLVAIVTLPNGEVLQHLLLKAGLAWVYSSFCKEVFPCNNWGLLQKEAWVNKTGLWADKNPVPPWEWRRAQRGAN